VSLTRRLGMTLHRQYWKRVVKSGFERFAVEHVQGKSPSTGLFTLEMMEATTRIELVIAVLQTAALTTWLRRRDDGAGDGIRTRDIQLGKLTLYH